MRAKEFINEASKFRRSATAAMPGTQVHQMNGNSYALYRFGVAMAGSPDNIGDTEGPSKGMNMVTLAYTDADRKIIDSAAAAMGAPGKQLTPDGSTESSTTYTKSPVANLGGIKRK